MLCTSASPVPSSVSHLPGVIFLSLISTFDPPTEYEHSDAITLWKRLKLRTYSDPTSSRIDTSTSRSEKSTLHLEAGTLRARIETITCVCVWYHS